MNMKKSDKIFGIVLGILLCVVGVGILIKPGFYDSRFDIYFDFSEIKWPFGCAVAIIGCAFLFITIRKKVTKEATERFYMCKRCMKPFSEDQIVNAKCPECGNGLEDLDGFYNMHPHLKDS